MKFVSFSPEKIAAMGNFEVIAPDETGEAPGGKAKKGQSREGDRSSELLFLPDLKEQYEARLSALRTAGVIEDLPSGKEGVIGIDGQEYPVPSFEEVVARCEAKFEMLKQKAEQGFVRIILTPFAMPLDALREKYKQRILEHHRTGKLLATKQTPSDPDEPLDLDENNPLGTWDGYNNADVNGKLLYYPSALDAQNHGAKTKAQVLSEQNPTGWDITLIEDMPNIPRAGKGETIGGRPQIDTAGMSITAYIEKGQLLPSPIEYLKAIQQDPIYQGEEGVTPEEDIVNSLIQLEDTDQISNDYHGKGSTSYNLGALFAASGVVPGSCWSRGDHQARLGRLVWDGRGSDCGVRLGVRV